MNTYSSLKNESIESLKKRAILARSAIIKATTLAGSGHPGGSMSAIDILLTLYEMLHIDPRKCKLEERDRIVISNGHISPGTYTALALNGFFPLEDFVSQFRLCGSIFEGHVERTVPGIEWGSGNLGQGLSAGCGFALAAKVKNLSYNVFVMMGDGEQQKGQLSEACRFAVKYGLNNITGIIDYNRLQISGEIDRIMPQNIKENYISAGWKVLEIDGHDFTEISEAVRHAAEIDKPAVIIANTVMGKGVSFMENKEKYHGSALSEDQLSAALEELGSENDLDHYRQLRESFPCKTRQELTEVSSKTEEERESAPFSDLDKGKAIVYDKPLDNRSAWGNALADLAKINKREPYTPIIVFDCDLQGSVKTNDFEKELPDNFIQSGIMEHHTAVMSGSVSLEGLQTFFVDFGVFGVDETYNQHRLNDINETNLKVIVTHVGLDVGEDGKTHQCLDYLALMRNLYHFRPIIPVCPNQTDRAIRYLINKKGNYLVAMGRSKVPVIKKEDGSLFYGEDYHFEYGKADLIRNPSLSPDETDPQNRKGIKGALLTMGTLASKGVEIVDRLKEKGILLQLWAVSCPNDIPEDSLRMAAEAGTIFTYEDHNVHTGLGSIVADRLLELQIKARLIKFGVRDYALSGKSEGVFYHAGLDVDTVMKQIEDQLQ
jgi:transketolase